MTIKKITEDRLCDRCDEYIGLPRLNVVPDADMCIRCAEHKELKWGSHRRTMEVIVKGQGFDNYDGYESFITSGKWVKRKPK